MVDHSTIRRSRHTRGISIVEILGLLALATVATFLFLERHQAPPPDTPEQQREKSGAAKNFVTTQTDTMMTAYKHDTGGFPTTAEGLWALIEAPPRVTGWKGPYLTTSTMPIDPWGQTYHYAFPGTHNGAGKFDVWSSGPDQLSGTPDDIKNW